MTQVNLLADSAWWGILGPVIPNNPAMTRPWLLWLVAAVAFLTGTAHAQVTYPPRPAEGEFIADAASLIQPQDKAKVRSTCEALLQSKGVPLLVVTINSMSDYGASGWPIERYAMNLFDEWGIGHSGNRNSGVLLLVSRNDRKVRIEMGAMWTHDRDALAASVINGTIVPRFKAGDFSGGIRDGVDALARQLGSPLGGAAPPSAGSNYGMPNSTTPTAPLHSTGMSRLLGPLACIIVPIVFIVIISIIPKIGRGLGGGSMGPGYGGGYGPAGWGGGWGGGGGGGFLTGALLGGLLGNAWGSRRSSGGWTGGGGFGGSSSGGFGGGGFGGGSGGGGSFGGGFSGGGGATGSW
jgi:uncharacterized protein